MSYNIDHWETIELEDLVIPIGLLESKFDSENWLTSPDHLLKINYFLGEDEGIVGTADGNNLCVDSIKIWGTGSGWDLRELETILKSSTGKLLVYIVWEGGDSHSLLEVNNGEVKHDDINIVELIRKSRENGQEI